MTRSEEVSGHPTRVDVLGVPVDAVDMRGAVAFADRALRSGATKVRIFAVNPEKVIALRNEPWLLEFFRGSELLIPDGIGVVWAAKQLHRVAISRVAGADLMQELCGLAAENGYPVFLFGAREEVSAGAASKLQARFPKLNIVGRANGFITAESAPELVNKINRSGARILFVALGSPKQERWIAEYGAQLKVNVIQGIGGTLDVVAGEVKRAPRVFRNMHLEWMYRLLSDPRRARRQAALPVFACRVLAAWLGGRR